MRRLIIMIMWVFISAQAETISIVADEWCPYNCDIEGEDPGYVIEIAKTIFEQEGHKIDYIGKMAWADALNETRMGKFDAVVGAYKMDAPDFIFPTLSQGVSSAVFITKKHNAWTYKGIASLENVCLGYIKGYAYTDDINAYISKHVKDPKRVQMVSGNGAIVYNMKKLRYEKIDTFIEDLYVAEYYFHLEGKGFPFKVAGEIYSTDVYIAFSPNKKSSKNYADILSKGMKRIRESGKLEAILQKYGLHDWK